MGSVSKIRVVIADDHSLFREGLRLILSDVKDLEIVGEAANGLQAIDVVTDLKPHVVLLDINKPSLDWTQIIPLIRQKSPKTKVLMLTAFADEDMILKSLELGAKGYLSKDANSPILIKAIKAVHRNEMWIQRTLIARYFNGHISSNSRGKNREEKTIKIFTPREHEVLSLLTRGLTNKEIAQSLFISEKTVKSHLNKVFKKLKVSRRLDAILNAIKMGLT